LDYFFDVLISLIYNLGLYNWFFHNYFTWCLITCSWCLLTTWFSIHQIYRFTCACPCTPFGTHLTTSWGVSNSLGSACL